VREKKKLNYRKFKIVFLYIFFHDIGGISTNRKCLISSLDQYNVILYPVKFFFFFNINPPCVDCVKTWVVFENIIIVIF
jgi:hypothetical protein